MRRLYKMIENKYCIKILLGWVFYLLSPLHSARRLFTFLDTSTRLLLRKKSVATIFAFCHQMSRYHRVILLKYRD